ncbi:MAG: hypothetical protein GY854_02780 [Deltaproteobacteria bacterium]|nr:hypothetical protein [Deltaproteobacteria bacterium]
MSDGNGRLASERQQRTSFGEARDDRTANFSANLLANGRRASYDPPRRTWRSDSELLDEQAMNERRSSSANVAIGDPSAKRDAADSDHFCKGGEWTDRHRTKPNITRRSVDSSVLVISQCGLQCNEQAMSAG